MKIRTVKDKTDFFQETDFSSWKSELPCLACAVLGDLLSEFIEASPEDTKALMLYGPCRYLSSSSVSCIRLPLPGLALGEHC